MDKNSISTLDKDSKEFILKNNLFEHVGADYSTYISSGIDGISTWGTPNKEVQVKKVKQSNSLMYPNELVYEATYKFDNQGCRITEKTSPTPSKVAIFFGDSMTFGEGLNCNETLPFYYEKLNKQYRSYNYGFLGHGPSHMLLHLKSTEFKSRFTGKKGTIFYVYRDDAIKVTVGQIPWGNGYPEFVLEDTELKYKGNFGDEEYTPDEMYLPSQYKNKDYTVTSEVFKQCNREIKKISTDLQLAILSVPLAFTSNKIETYLCKEDIKFFNFSFTDIEFFTNTNARFLDGIHTSEANKVLATKLTYYLENPYHIRKIPQSKLSSIEEVVVRVKERCFLLPSMVDFPYDDAGVIISIILQEYSNEVPVEYDLMEIAKSTFMFKLSIANELSIVRSREKLIALVGEVSKNSYFIDILYDEYVVMRLINN